MRQLLHTAGRAAGAQLFLQQRGSPLPEFGSLLRFALPLRSHCQQLQCLDVIRSQLKCCIEVLSSHPGFIEGQINFSPCRQDHVISGESLQG